MFISVFHNRLIKRLFIAGIATVCATYAIDVFAVQLPTPNCTLPGCSTGSSGAADLVSQNLIPTLATIALNTVAGLAVVFGIIGGARFVLSAGRDEEVQKGKATIQWALIGVVVALMSHSIVMAILSHPYAAIGSSDPITALLSDVVFIMMALLNVVFFIMILVGGVRMVMARGAEEEVKKGRSTVLYAIAGVIVINVIPFVVKAVLNL